MAIGDLELTGNDPEDVANEILSSDRSRPGFDLTVSEFRDVYELVHQRLPGTPVHIVLNGDWAMAQFSRISNQRIRIIREPRKGRFGRFFKRKLLSEADFDFALLYANLYGAHQPLNFTSFLKEELSGNTFKLIATLFSSLAIFLLIARYGTRDDLSQINQILLTVSTLYLSIFLLFTVSQSIESINNQYFFQAGLTHRFFMVDRFVASLALITLVMCILNLVLLIVPANIDIHLSRFSFQVPDFVRFAAILTAIAITLLVDSFLALIQYYFSRVQYIMEQELTGELLDSFVEHNEGQIK